MNFTAQPLALFYLVPQAFDGSQFFSHYLPAVQANYLNNPPKTTSRGERGDKEKTKPKSDWKRTTKPSPNGAKGDSFLDASAHYPNDLPKTTSRGDTEKTKSQIRLEKDHQTKPQRGKM